MADSSALSDALTQLAEVERLIGKSKPSTTRRLMWESRRQALLQRISEIKVVTDNQAKVAILFDGAPVVHSKKIRLDFATKALQRFQELVAAFFADQMQHLGSRGPLPFRSESRLFISGVAHGSFGFWLQEEDKAQSEALPTPLSATLTHVMNFLPTLTDTPSSLATVSALSPRLLSSIKTFTSVLSEHRSDLKLEQGERSLVISADTFGQLSSTLEEIEIRDQSETFDGELIGFMTDAGTFEAIQSGRLISGLIEDDLLSRLREDPHRVTQNLFHTSRLTIRRVQTVRLSAIEKEQHILVDINDTESEPARLTQQIREH